MVKAFTCNTKSQCEYCGEISKNPARCCDKEMLDFGTEYDLEYWAPEVDSPEDFGEINHCTDCKNCGKKGEIKYD